MEKIPGYWEHLSMAWHALKKAKVLKSNLTTVWLDIANTFGSIPNRLILFALHRYDVSLNSGSDLLQHTAKEFTISIILFLYEMNIVLEYSKAARTLNLLLTLPLPRAFMMT